jgi:hypothetical protein
LFTPFFSNGPATRTNPGWVRLTLICPYSGRQSRRLPYRRAAHEP